MDKDYRQIFSDAYKLYEVFKNPPAMTEHPEDRVTFWDRFASATNRLKRKYNDSPLAVGLAEGIFNAVVVDQIRGGEGNGAG